MHVKRNIALGSTRRKLLLLAKSKFFKSTQLLWARWVSLLTSRMLRDGLVSHGPGTRAVHGAQDFEEIIAHLSHLNAPNIVQPGQPSFFTCSFSC